MSWVKVDLPEEMKSIRAFLQNCSRSTLAEMNKYGYLNREKGRNISKIDLLKLQGLLHAEISKGNREFEVLNSISLAAEAIKVQHALELLETQGITPLHKCLEKIEEESLKTKSKAVQNYYWQLIEKAGSEFAVILDMPIPENSWAYGLSRLRNRHHTGRMQEPLHRRRGDKDRQ